MFNAFATALIFWLVLIAVLVMSTGCSEEDIRYGDLPFVDMTVSGLSISEQNKMCKEVPDSVFCENSPSIGDIQPDYSYSKEVLLEANSNFDYVIDDTWHYNQTVHEHLSGDCEDIASTMAQHMINDGIGKEYLYMVYRKLSDTESHLFLAVDTTDRGLLHLDYANSGYPIEPQINFHLPLNDVRVWVKGNIE